MSGRRAKPPKHWLARKYAEERAREEGSNAAEQRREREKNARLWRELRARDAWIKLDRETREGIIATMRHDALHLGEERDEDSVMLGHAFSVAADLLEATEP